MSRTRGSKKYTPVMDGLWDWKHYQKMKAAVFLFGELLSRTDRTGKVEVTYTVIQEKTGIPLRTLERWMSVLKRKGYIIVSGKNPMTIEIQNFRRIRNGRIPSNMAGQENPKPSNVAETLQNVAGPDSLTPLETKTSKPFLKYKKKRESLSPSRGSKSNTKADKKTNPDIRVAMSHYRTEYLRIHQEQPFLNGTAQKTFKRLIEGDEKNQNLPIPIGELKELITTYLSQADGKLKEKGYPVEWLPGSISGLLLQKKQPEQGFVF